MKTILKTALFTSIFLALCQSARSEVFDVTLNTSSLVGNSAGPFYLYFSLTDGEGIGDANNKVTIRNVNFGGGNAFGNPITFGGATGSLATGITLTDSSGLSFLNEQIAPGAQLSFSVELTFNDDVGETPDGFSFFILDNSGIPVGTLAPYGDYFLGVDLKSTDPIFDIFGSDQFNVPISITFDDKKAPVAFAIATPEPNANGWNNTDVTVEYGGTDNLSGISNCSPPVTLGTDAANQSASGTCIDRAGNLSAPAIISGINIDKTPPALTFGAASPAANLSGWNNTNVSIPFAASDSLAGIGNVGSATNPLVLSAEGSAVSAEVIVTDRADNTATFNSPAVKIDKTPPSVAVTASPMPNANGWNNSNVTVMFNGSDGLSGIANCSPTIAISTEGANQSASGTCSDNAGNLSVPATISGINIDKTAPLVSSPATITIPATRADGATAAGSLSLTTFLAAGLATDNLDALPVRLPTQASGIDVNPSSVFPLGTTGVTFRYRDGAGNVGSATADVTVIMGQPSLSGAITAKGIDGTGMYYIDLRFTNTGTGNARNLSINQLPLRTLSGTGTVSLAGPLPLQIGNLDAGSAITLRVYLNRPTTVTRFSITENGTVQGVSGASFNYSIAQSVIP